MLRQTTLSALLLFVSSSCLAQGVNGLLITPTKLVLEGSQRTAQCTLMNTTDSKRTYRINLVDMRMTETGELEASTTPDEYSAKDLIRYAPREISLGPGESQKIRLLVTRPATLAAGEYRSHLQFVPTTVEPVVAATRPDANGLSVGIRLRTIITIPVIVRSGTSEAKASLGEASIVTQPEGWVLRCRVGRSGNRSIRGDLTLSFVPSDRANPIVLGQARDLAVYRPNAFRVVRLSIPRPKLASRSGTLRVSFSEPGERAVSIDLPAPQDAP